MNLAPLLLLAYVEVPDFGQNIKNRSARDSCTFWKFFLMVPNIRSHTEAHLLYVRVAHLSSVEKILNEKNEARRAER